MNPHDLHGLMAVGSFWLIVATVCGAAIVALLWREIRDEVRLIAAWWREIRGTS